MPEYALLVAAVMLTGAAACLAAGLWAPGREFPSPDRIPLISPGAVEYRRVHTAEQPNTFAIGAALVRFAGLWRCSWAANPDNVAENQDTEFVVERVSSDGGRTWARPAVLAPPLTGGAFHSHGSYFAAGGELLFYAKRGPWPGPVEAFRLAEARGRWESLGAATVGGCAFWAMDAPKPTAGGGWIMGGTGGPTGKMAAVALSRRGDPLGWEVSLLPGGPSGGIEETTVLVGGERVVALSRGGRNEPFRLSVSDDSGASWRAAGDARIPMEAAKPFAGRLSDGRPYLLGNLLPPEGQPPRSRLCMLLGQPGAMGFDHVWMLRDPPPPAARFSGPQHNAQWAYPYACEADGDLYVAHHGAKEDIDLIVVRPPALA